MISIDELNKLKKKIETCKSERDMYLGQEQQLNEQKKALMDEFNANGVTKDTIESTIQLLEADIKKASDEIDLLLSTLKSYE